MSQDVGRTELRAQTEQLLDGPLKHARAAALAAALLPLASVAVSTASAEMCSSAGTVCGVVWQDTNHDGIQDEGEPGVPDAVVTLGSGPDALVTWTNSAGVYEFFVPPGTYEIAVSVPPGTEASQQNATDDDTIDSDGKTDGLGNSVATVTYLEEEVYNSSTDFGFWVPPVAQPGTGTPGYWKNHPDAWPIDQITVGGVTYSKAEALAWLEKVGKDRTITMFSSLVPAKLNVIIGNDRSCVSSTIDAADSWMMTYGPVGSGVHAASFAWKVGEPLHRQMDNYNNGMLCAPHRD